MLEVTTILGARPQFVKAAVVSRAIEEHNRNAPNGPIHETIIHTGQHYDANMSDVFFRQMGIPKPDRFLNINRMGHGALTGRMLEAIESELVKQRPDLLLVYGDTNSTLAGALAAAKLHIPIAHVEAGLRSFNRQMPEEHNRVLTDHLSSLLFCPTKQAVDNLKREGLTEYPLADPLQSKTDAAPRIFQVGDVMHDAALYYRRKAEAQASIAGPLIRNRLDGKPFALLTLHRQENTDNPDRLSAIVSALVQLSEILPIVWPMHPRTHKAISAADLSGQMDRPNLIVIDPVSYFDMLGFLEGCTIVLTDSGGLQKEAYFFKKPCVTLREETEWVELVKNGYNRTVGADPGRIIEAVDAMRHSDLRFNEPLYGEGDSGAQIVSIIAAFKSEST